MIQDSRDIQGLLRDDRTAWLDPDCASPRQYPSQDRYRALFDRLADYVDGGIPRYRDYVDEFVAEIDQVPGMLAAGQLVNITKMLVLELDPAVVTAWQEELARVIIGPNGR